MSSNYIIYVFLHNDVSQFFDMQMQISDLIERTCQKYVLFLRETLHKVSGRTLI